jgi:hypothetical protein
MLFKVAVVLWIAWLCGVLGVHRVATARMACFSSA